MQSSVLSTRYSVHSVFRSWYSVLNTQEHCLAAVQCVVACCCCCCLSDPLVGEAISPVVSLAVPGPSTAVRITRTTRTNEVDTRDLMRQQVNLHCATHREQTICIQVAMERRWITFAPSATVGILPTAASWTNSPPPHSSIHWDDHITGTITSTSWDDDITGMITSTNKDAKLWTAHF